MILRHKRTVQADSLRLFDPHLPAASLKPSDVRRTATNERRVATRAL